MVDDAPNALAGWVMVTVVVALQDGLVLSETTTT